MKRLLFIIGALFLWVAPVSAHVLKTDNNIGGLLHIDPNDEPVAGKPSGLVLELKDKAGQFTTAKCNCQATITMEGGAGTTQAIALIAASSDTLTASTTFAQPGVYKISFVGAPQSGESFQPFTLQYDVRVEGEGTNSSNLPVIILFGVVVTGFIGALIWSIVRSKKEPQHEHDHTDHDVY